MSLHGCHESQGGFLHVLEYCTNYYIAWHGRYRLGECKLCRLKVTYYIDPRATPNSAIRPRIGQKQIIGSRASHCCTYITQKAWHFEWLNCLLDKVFNAFKTPLKLYLWDHLETVCLKPIIATLSSSFIPHLIYYAINSTEWDKLFPARIIKLLHCSKTMYTYILYPSNLACFCLHCNNLFVCLFVGNLGGALVH